MVITWVICGIAVGWLAIYLIVRISRKQAASSTAYLPPILEANTNQVPYYQVGTGPADCGSTYSGDCGSSGDGGCGC